MQALILAAGMGKRLGRYTQEATKCMVPVNGKTLIEYAIESLVKNNIKKLIIVVGYKSQVLIDFISTKFTKETLKGMEIQYIENTIYDKTNNIYSLYLACNELIKDDTILLESDLIYKSEIITQLINNPEKNLAVVSQFESWMDGTCALIDENKNITKIIDKNHFKWENTDTYFKTVNIYKFSKEFSKNYYVPFLDSYQRAYGTNEYYEQVLKVLSFLSPTLLKALPVSEDDWYEIDDPADLSIAENRFADSETKLKMLKQRNGGLWRFPKLIDFCNLTNSYFPPQKMMNELEANFKTLLTQYPSDSTQQSLLAGKIFNILPEHIVVGNGAAELISSLGEKLSGKIVIPYPTFNEYPERFTNCEIIALDTASNNFEYSIDDILKTVKENKAQSVLLINPDNPSGNFICKDEILKLCGELKKLDAKLFFDESFIDFADKDLRYTLLDEETIKEYPNLIVVKSISKSYGVPGLRLGVLACSNEEYISHIKKTNSIWNINSFAEYYLQIYEKYSKTYPVACDSIAFERNRFINELSKIKNFKVYPSQANFIICKLEGKVLSKELAIILMENHNIFIKDLTGKRCFDNGRYIRLAIRDENDNNKLIEALKMIEL